jgi:hypothetical protein
VRGGRRDSEEYVAYGRVDTREGKEHHQPDFHGCRCPVSDDPIDLDEHRGMAAQKDTEIRRRLHEVQADQAALRARQAELEKFLVSAAATTWPEAAAKARYLLELFSVTPEAQDPRRQKLIASVISDFSKLSE